MRGRGHATQWPVAGCSTTIGPCWLGVVPRCKTEQSRGGTSPNPGERRRRCLLVKAAGLVVDWDVRSLAVRSDGYSGALDVHRELLLPGARYFSRRLCPSGKRGPQRRLFRQATQQAAHDTGTAAATSSMPGTCEKNHGDFLTVALKTRHCRDWQNSTFSRCYGHRKALTFPIGCVDGFEPAPIAVEVLSSLPN